MKRSLRLGTVLCLAVFSLLSIPAFVNAQPHKSKKITSNKIVEEAIVSMPPIDTSLFPYVQIDSWEGRRFIFLAAPKASENDIYDDFSGRLIRRQYQGRVAKVTGASDFSGRIHLELEMEDTKERLRARSLPGKESIKGIALVDDLSNARAQWAGKTLWCREPRLSTYDELNDQVGVLAIKRYSPLKVLDIVAGWDEEKPARFLLATSDGKRGFLDLNLSGTNVFKEVRQLNRMEQYFLAEDPRKIYKWPAHVWNLIESSQIITGMTAAQVKMSWGEPEKITPTATGESWNYMAGTLIFKKGVLTGKQ
ncbi:MAG: hypothetical protein J2P31_05715 [Blastocatellia bacterium]|nr:hypothetical protein [Blastocatellia bacterium]